MNALRSAMRSLGFGRAALLLWHRPLGLARDSLRNGGPLAVRVTERQRAEMERAAANLPPLPAPADPIGTVHLMTGRRFWYQTVFCLHSLTRSAGRGFHVELYDDGSIDSECATALARLGAGVRIHRIDELRERRDAFLPASRYPALRERWENYPNIRKLIDVHAGSRGWKLVLDSDLLFFRRPDALLDWLATPRTPLHAIDCAESYGYSRPLLEELAGAALPERVNVGICGLCSEDLDWDQLEHWTRQLHARERTSYYLEQALVAMLAARQPMQALPAADYVTRPDQREVLAPRAVMHHYVDTSKRWYFRHGWRGCL